MLKIKCIDGGKLPKWNQQNAGLDLYANEDCIVGKNICKIPLGIATEFPPQYVGLIKGRSGLASQGLLILAGVIDSSYRGEWIAAVKNLTDNIIIIKRHDRICQVIFPVILHLQITEVDKLTESIRGSSGFGASGK